MLRPAGDRINTATFFMIIEKKNPQTVKKASNSHQLTTIKDDLGLGVELMLPEQTPVSHSHLRYLRMTIEQIEELNAIACALLANCKRKPGYSVVTSTIYLYENDREFLRMLADCTQVLSSQV